MPTHHEPAVDFRRATNHELAGALDGIADGQDDDLGAMLTEAARRLRGAPFEMGDVDAGPYPCPLCGDESGRCACR